VITGSALRPSPGGRCRSFSGDTEVLMADGTSKRIDLLQVGDMVLAKDPETGERGPRPVVDVWFHDDLLIDLRIENDRLTTTEDHQMWNATDQAWQESQDIDPGEAVLTADGEHLEVGGLDWLSARTGTAYNLTVDDIHTYFVMVDDEAVLVHNCGGSDAVDGPVQGPIEPGRVRISDQQQNAHVAGTPEHQRRVDADRPPSTFRSRIEADSYTQYTWRYGQAGPEPHIRDFTFDHRVGTGGYGGAQYTVRVSMNKSGAIHGSPWGRVR